MGNFCKKELVNYNDQSTIVIAQSKWPKIKRFESVIVGKFSPISSSVRIKTRHLAQIKTEHLDLQITAHPHGTKLMRS